MDQYYSNFCVLFCSTGEVAALSRNPAHYAIYYTRLKNYDCCSIEEPYNL